MKTTAKILALTLALLSVLCILTGCGHKHTFAEEWSKDETNHWHAATCKHADKTSDLAAHTWDAGKVTTPATEEAAGVKTFTCTVCGATKTEAIAQLPHTHKYSTEWNKDSDSHWHDATCEHTSETDSRAEHTFGEWVTDVEENYGVAGSRHKECSVCGYRVDEVIPALDAIAPILSWDGSSNLAKTYDGNAVAAPAFTTNSDGQVSIIWKNGNEVLKSAPTDAGSYSVTVSVSATAHYTKAEISKDFTISKKAPSLSFGSDFKPSKTYDGSAVANAVYSTDSDGNVSVTWKRGNETLAAAPTNAGEYTVIVSVAEGKNYTAKDISKDFLISKKVPSLEFNANWQPDKVYDGATVATPAAGTGYLTESNGTVTVSWKMGNVPLSDVPVNAGSYTVTVSVAEAVNFQAASISKDVVISKKETTLAWTTYAPGKTYDGVAVSGPVLNTNYTSDGDGVLTVTWKKGNEAHSSYPVNAGTYTVIVSAAETENFQAAEITKDFVILKKATTLAWTTYTPGKDYDGTAVSAPVLNSNYTSDGDGAITVSWKQDDEVINAAPKDAGNYSVTLSAAETQNYLGATLSKFFIIEKVTPVLTWNSNYKPGKTYDNHPVADPICGTDYSINFNDAIVTFTWKVGSESTSYATVNEAKNANAPAMNYLLSISIDDCTNFNPVTISKEFTITPKALTLGDQAFTGDGIKTSFDVNVSNGVIEGTVTATYTFAAATDGSALASVTLSNTNYSIMGTPVATLHVHSYATGWTNNDSYHWHASACGHTDEISGKAIHSYTDYGVCEVCGYCIAEAATVGSEIEPCLESGNKVYSFTLKDGTDYVLIENDGNHAGRYGYEFYGPDGQLIKEVWDGSSSFIDFVSGGEGIHYLVVYNNSADDDSMTFTLYEADKRLSIFTQDKALPLNAGETKVVSFLYQGESNGKVNLLTSITQDYYEIKLFSSDIFATSEIANDNNDNNFIYTIPSIGWYYLVVTNAEDTDFGDNNWFYAVCSHTTYSEYGVCKVCGYYSGYDYNTLGVEMNEYAEQGKKSYYRFFVDSGNHNISITETGTTEAHYKYSIYNEAGSAICENVFKQGTTFVSDISGYYYLVIENVDFEDIGDMSFTIEDMGEVEE